MAANWSDSELNPPKLNPAWPPGDTDYPTKVNLLIDHAEDVADELEVARENESNLLTNLSNNYISSTLTNNIDGDNIYKFTNMVNATVGPTSKDYITFSQLQGLYSINDLSAFTADAPLNIPTSQLIVKDDDSFTLFESKPSTPYDDTTANNYFRPDGFNKTFTLDWTTADSNDYFNLVVPGTPPKNGDRLRLIFSNTAATNDSIQDATYKIQGLTEKILFGAVFDMVIYDMIYVGSPNGWFFSNVFLGQ